MAATESTLLSDPIRLLSVLFIFAAVFLWFAVGLRLYKSYREKGHKQSLYISLFFITASMAIVFLIGEQAVYLVEKLEDMATFQTIFDLINEKGVNSPYVMSFISAAIAIFLSSVSLVFINLFALSFQEGREKWASIIALMLAIYVAIFTFMPFKFVAIEGDWQPQRQAEIELSFLALLVIPVFFSAVFLLYVTVKSRKSVGDWNPQVKRLAFITVAQFVVSTAYMIEILNLPTIFSLLSRFFFLLYGIMMYLAFIQPSFFKRWLGIPT